MTSLTVQLIKHNKNGTDELNKRITQTVYDVPGPLSLTFDLHDDKVRKK